MSTDPKGATRPLPDRPNLRHLKAQAKDLLRAGAAKSLTDAQFQLARQYGFASWPKLKAHVESLEEVGQLKQAIDRDEFERVKTMMTRNASLHRAPLGYGNDGPLTLVADLRCSQASLAAWQSCWRDLVFSASPRIRSTGEEERAGFAWPLALLRTAFSVSFWDASLCWLEQVWRLGPP